MSISDQKLCTEFWLSSLSFCLGLDSINSRFKSHLDNKLKKRFYKQRARKAKCRRIKAVDKDIFITYRFSDRKFSLPIITTIDLLQEQGIQSNSASLFSLKLLTNVRSSCPEVFCKKGVLNTSAGCVWNVMWMKSLSKTESWNEIHRSLLHLPWPYHFIW